MEATVASREVVEQAIDRALGSFAAEDLATLRRDLPEELHALRRETTAREDHAALVHEMAQMRREMATKAYVGSVVSQAKAEIIKWHAGIVIVRTVAVMSVRWPSATCSP